MPRMKEYICICESEIIVKALDNTSAEEKAVSTMVTPQNCKCFEKRKITSITRGKGLYDLYP